MTHEIWRAILPLMSSNRRYILPDLTGFGGSTGSLNESYTLKRLACDLVGLLDYLDIKRAHIVGASLGGMVAIKLASLVPQRLRSLTVFNTVAHAETPFGKERRDRQLADVRSQGVARFTSRFAAGLFPEGTPEPIVQFLADNMAKASVESVIAGLKLLRDREDQTAQLKMIVAPTLMIAGGRDNGSSPEMMGQMARLCPRGELRIIDGAGHMPSIQMPHLAASILEDWLSNSGANCPAQNGP
ncbi:alpha/beta fold hydrolase [Erythrobacter sp. WH131]|uniref:Alpha/beta fold hydrolase n=2 Tax=Erythrobacter ani TaxID=2827235 RepID=A0ABS6SML0_9SPHN|nr:alpha/beta fold hydrolase [Erythrobacter ani]